jgi:Family of unknown function (DUF5681)
MPKQDLPYEVGYAKPPKGGQFAKGASGNPKGRPRGSKNLATIVLKESRQLVRVNGPHGSREVTKLEAGMMQLGNKSAQGDLRALREFLALVARSEESLNSGTQTADVHESDERMMQSILKRFSALQVIDRPTSTEAE